MFENAEETANANDEPANQFDDDEAVDYRRRCEGGSEIPLEVR
jgi:hypothetical protein